MSDVVIRVENLSKKYIIGHQKQERYTALRDVVSNGAKSLWQGLTGNRGTDSSDISEEFWALKDVSFEVKQGDRIGIIGRNGAGKSTLLKILSRITQPTSGKISIRGKVSSLLEVGTGFHPELTGRENIFLNGAILGMGQTEIKKKFIEIVDFAEIEKFIDTPVKHYSSGMYVRLAFAVAAHLEPDILVIDEVLAVGDMQFQKKCLGKIDEISTGNGRTVIFVSHNMGTVRSLCNRSILLRGGNIQYDGAVDNSIEQYLNHDHERQAVIKYKPNPKQEIQIQQVRLLDHNGSPSSYLDMLQTFTVEIDYEVRERINGVVIGANLFTSFNESIVATCDFDLNKDKLKTREVGIHKTWVTFPSNLFNSGFYNLVVGISIPGKIIYDCKEVTQFELFDSGSFVINGGGEERRNATLLIPIEWDQ